MKPSRYPSLLLLPEDKKRTPTLLFRRFATFMILLAIFVGGMAQLERLSDPPSEFDNKANPPLQKCKRNARGELPNRCKVYILLIDSLRYETALSKSIMPFFNKLRRQGLHGRLRSCKDHNTVPCVRAAMEGRYRTSIFGFIRNFSNSNNLQENVLQQAKLAGKRIYMYSHKIVHKRYTDAVQKFNSFYSDSHSTRKALAAYRSGKYDVIFQHMINTDYISHGYGVETKTYKRVFREADDLLKRVVKTIPKDVNLLVWGDHGHDKNGSHRFGLDTPSYYIMRSPHFSKGVRQNAEIKAVRYFISEGLGLTLPRNYEGKIYPEHQPKRKQARRVKRKKIKLTMFQKAGFWLSLLFLGLVFLIWYWMQIQMEVTSLSNATYRWISMLTVTNIAVAFWAGQSWSLILAILCNLFILHHLSRPWNTQKIWGILIVLLPFAFVGWGRFLMAFRYAMDDTRLRHLMGLFFIIACGIVAIGLFARLRITLHLLWGLGAFLAVPTVYFFGAMSSLFAALYGFILFLVFRPIHHMGPGAFSRFPSIFLGKLLMIPCLIPLYGFLYIEANQFVFRQFYLFSINFSQTNKWLSGTSMTRWALAFLVFSKFVIYLDTKLKWWQFPLPLALGGAVGYYEFTQNTKHAAILCGWLLFTTLVLFLFARHFRWANRLLGRNFYGSRVFLFASMQLAMVYMYRTKPIYLVCLNIFLAAIMMIARVIKLFNEDELNRVGPVVLAIIGYLGSFWFTLHWGTGYLEWNFVYDFLTAPQAEKYIVLVTTTNILKYLIPVFLIRSLLSTQFPVQLPAIQHRAHFWIGLKLISLLGILYGFGATSYSSKVFDEGMQQAIITLVCLLGVLF